VNINRMTSNIPYTPFLEGLEDNFLGGHENWETYLKSESENIFSLSPPAPGAPQVTFEQAMEMPEKMEEDFNPYDQQQPYSRTFVEEIDFAKQPSMRVTEPPRPMDDYDGAFYENYASECPRYTPAAPEQEEVQSVSTKDSMFADFNNEEFSLSPDGNQFYGTPSDTETELATKVWSLVRTLPEEEKAYIKKIFPLLLESVKETLTNYQFPLNDEIVRVILQQLLYGREQIVGAEKQALNRIIQNEDAEIRSQRPNQMVTEEDLSTRNRKDKKAVKGHRNGSSMNHFNENYVSNIFQFAKRNYPEDREVQRIASARNVSALNFRRLIRPNITDDAATRKAKARIIESGRELVGNIEYWMKDGYFEQCADREKYIHYKEKALRDLALIENF